ncbi:hypothetical protein [Caviibacter abscessus]|uniref:hypothetical protein n=1 Tax=Caviibacter abscessus TaxID=1766719 RepID=UPI0008295EAC|nr:hypothetical protein [Caviibacter abscessus]
MIYVYIKINEIFFDVDGDIYFFNYSDINNDINNIVDQLVIQENEKVFMILDSDKQDAKIYIAALKQCKLATKKLIYLYDIFLSLKKDILIVGDKLSIKIENSKIEELDIKKSDSFDFDGFEHIYINHDSIGYIFELCKNSKIKNRLSLNINFSNISLIFCIFILFICYLISSYLYEIKNIENGVINTNNKINEIDIKINEVNKNVISKEDEISRLPNTDKFMEELGRKNIYILLDKLLNLSKNNVNYSNIKYVNDEIIIEGIADNYSDIEAEFYNAKIEYLLNTEYGIKFKIRVKVINNE